MLLDELAAPPPEDVFGIWPPGFQPPSTDQLTEKVRRTRPARSTGFFATLLGENLVSDGDLVHAAEQVRREAWRLYRLNRPMNVIGRRRQPLPAMRQALSQGGGTLYLGFTTTIDETPQAAGREDNMVVIAPTRSGKTLGLASPQVATHPGPVVFASVKTDGIEHSARARAIKGRAWLFDPWHSVSDAAVATLEDATGVKLYRLYWNQLAFVRGDWDRSLLAATSLIKGAKFASGDEGGDSQHWDTLAQLVVAPMFLAASLHQDGTMDWLREWITNYDLRPAAAILQAALQDFANDERKRVGIKAALDLVGMRARDRTDHNSDVMQTVVTHISSLMGTDAMLDASRLNFDPDAFVASGDVIYFAGDARAQKQTASQFIALLDEIFQATKRADEADRFVSSSRPPVFVCLDEAANIAPTPYLNEYLSTGAGYGFQLAIYLQTHSQAERAWKTEGKHLLSFPVTKVAFGGEYGDPDLLEAFSKMSGDYDREYIAQTTGESSGTVWGVSTNRSWSTGGFSSGSGSSRGGNSGTNTSSTTTYQKERHLTPADVSNLPPGYAMVAARGTCRVLRVSDPELISWWIDVMNRDVVIPQWPAPQEFAIARPIYGDLDRLVAWNDEWTEREKQSAPPPTEASGGAGPQQRSRRREQQRGV